MSYEVLLNSYYKVERYAGVAPLWRQWTPEDGTQLASLSFLVPLQYREGKYDPKPRKELQEYVEGLVQALNGPAANPQTDVIQFEAGLIGFVIQPADRFKVNPAPERHSKEPSFLMSQADWHAYETAVGRLLTDLAERHIVDMGNVIAKGYGHLIGRPEYPETTFPPVGQRVLSALTSDPRRFLDHLVSGAEERLNSWVNRLKEQREPNDPGIQR